MNLMVAASNGITITTSMVCMSYLYRFHWKGTKPRPLIASAAIITMTCVVFELQFAYPEILATFRRDAGGLKSGEWWRLVTPLFVQPHGWPQLLFNMMFLAVFLPLAERLYGLWIWLLYFGSGVFGQLANYSWLPEGGGSSTAAFGLMGALMVYVIRQRRSVPKQYLLFAALGLCGAVAMCFMRDGHGAGFLSGAFLAALIYGRSQEGQPNSALHASREDVRA
jgi:membrane associated rhomboid family serine protease